MKSKPTNGYKAKAVKGGAATALAQGTQACLQVISTVVLSRLLAPTDFGIVAMVAPIVAFVSLFQDLGLQQAIIQARDVSRAQVSRMFWINVLVSALIGLVLVLVSPLVGLFYGDSRVVALTVAWSIPLLLAAIAAQHFALLSRDLRFGAIAQINVLSSVAAFSVAILGALLLNSYWALWCSVCAGGLTTAVLAWRTTRWRPCSPQTPADTRGLLKFGFNFAGFNFMNYFSRNLDNVIVAKMFGAPALGIYDRSYKLLLSPLSNINAPIGRVMLPILGRLGHDPDRYRKAYLQTAALLTWVCVPGVSALAIVANDFVPLLLGDRWAAASPVFAWLGLAGVSQPLANSVGWLFLSQHRTTEMLQWGTFSAVTTIASFLIGTYWGVAGVAAAYAISSLFLRLPLLFLWIGRKGPVTTRDLFSIQIPVLASSAVCLCLVRWLQSLVSLNAIATIFTSIVLSYALALALITAQPTTRRFLLLIFHAARTAVAEKAIYSSDENTNSR